MRGDEAQVAAAWLHDVVEDTPIPLTHVRAVFGSDVAQLVQELTDKFTKQNYPGLNRHQRKAKEVERLSKISDRAKTIKYADFLSNLESVSVLGPNFGEVYTREVAEALRSMHGGDETLRSAALVAGGLGLREGGGGFFLAACRLFLQNGDRLYDSRQPKNPP